MWRRPLEWNLNGTTEPRDGSVDHLSLNSLKDRRGPIRAPKSLDAIEVIRAAVDGGRQYYELDEIAVEDVIRPKWRDIVIEDAPNGTRRVNRINYEICVLQSLRDRLRCREVWVVG